MTDNLPANPASGVDNTRPKLGLGNDGDRTFFGEPPLIPGEDPRAYARLFAEVTACLNPMDILEAIWVQEFVYLQWDIMRLRRIGPNLITMRFERSKEERAFAYNRSSDKVTPAERDGDVAAIVAKEINVLGSLNHMLTSLEVRRNAAYREIERHRVGLGNQLRHVVGQIEDAEFSVSESQPEQKSAA
jgi:hypothetical protein